MRSVGVRVRLALLRYFVGIAVLRRQSADSLRQLLGTAAFEVYLKARYVMTKTKDADLMARELRLVSPEIGDVGASNIVDGMQVFSLRPARKLTTDEMIAVCRLLAAEIRANIPERPDEWTSAIHFWQRGGSIMQPMGVYFLG